MFGTVIALPLTRCCCLSRNVEQGITNGWSFFLLKVVVERLLASHKLLVQKVMLRTNTHLDTLSSYGVDNHVHVGNRAPWNRCHGGPSALVVGEQRRSVHCFFYRDLDDCRLFIDLAFTVMEVTRKNRNCTSHREISNVESKGDPGNQNKHTESVLDRRAMTEKDYLSPQMRLEKAETL